ncbi:MAG: DUF1735 domain-containing protein [Chitinophagaceae bacterium]|nr:DUF1735 domain-containing protein [Chitinophagaceae bacterium]
MNNYVKKIFIGAPVILLLGLSSCLKNTVIPPSDPLGGTNSVIAFVATGDITSITSLYPQYAQDLLFKGDTIGFNLNVGYRGATTAPQDITVTLAVDLPSLAAFNTNQGSSYVVPDASVYSFPTTLTIPKGKDIATGRIIINKATYDFSKAYGLPIKITAASSGIVSTNFGTAIYTFSARNEFDGLYSVTFANMVDVVNPSLVAPATPYNVQLRTYSANSVAMWDPVYAKTYGHWIMNGASSSYYGSFSPIFIIGAGGAITSIVNYYGQPASNGRSAQMDGTAVNKYDAATKTFTVQYFMLQGGPVRTTFTEVYKYLSPR